MELNSVFSLIYEDIAAGNPTTIYKNILHLKIGLQMYAQMSEASDINLYWCVISEGPRERGRGQIHGV